MLMLPTCKQVAEQLSDNLDEPLTGIKWLKLKLHLLMCVYCKRYAKQLALSATTIGLLEQATTPSQALHDKIIQHYKDCHRHQHD